MQQEYSFDYYPSTTHTYKRTKVQFLIEYTNNNKSLITLPIEIRSSDYFESVGDIKMISTHVIPEDNIKLHKFITDKYNYIVETSN